MSKKLFVLFSFVAFIAAALMINQTAAQNAAGCDPAYVTVKPQVVVVSPTGVDDTANLQCAFDTAVANTGTNVQLTAGTFHTAQIVVNDFTGKFFGNGADKTEIRNLPNLYVTPQNMYFTPPSAANPWPALFSFVNGDFKVAHLAIQIVGDDLTTGWSIFGLPPIEELAGAIYILGTHANAEFSNVTVAGEAVADVPTLFGYNLINGIFFEGFLGQNLEPISGSFTVQNSRFAYLASGTPVFNLVDADMVIRNNQFSDVFYGLDGTGLINTSVTFVNNDVSAQNGLSIYDGVNPELVNTDWLIGNNRFSGANGVSFYATFGDGNDCRIVNNKMSDLTDTGIFLGEGTHDFYVVARNTTIYDYGVNNVIRGRGNTILP